MFKFFAPKKIMEMKKKMSHFRHWSMCKHSPLLTLVETIFILQKDAYRYLFNKYYNNSYILSDAYQNFNFSSAIESNIR